MHKLTKRQTAILEAIRNYIDQNHYAPTVREVGQAVGLTSSSTIMGHLERLRKKGFVTWEQGRPRTLRVIERPAG
ncbi:transcriptional regulator [Fictibacillus gelatini]|uniref:LexA family protein n=1 Tax=Fictibacillus gelatini TaxID=225985 RepID=UPI0009D684AD|nr:transcriptional regulator [Fictibacillus gelatini]